MIGVDIVKIDRIKKAVESDHFVQRIFRPSERKYANNACMYAGIYAAKEAVFKLSGRGIIGSFTDIEIGHDNYGAPTVTLSGKIGELLKDKVCVSISHDGEYAVAVASYDKKECVPILPGREICDGDMELLKRSRFTHKGDYGRVYVIGGSPYYVGAPLISAEAAAVSGAGLTTLCVQEELLPAYRERVKEIMLFGLSGFDEAALSEICGKANSIIIGMGMKNAALPQILAYIFSQFAGTVVCDAEAINALCSPLIFSERKCRLILTPHVGEFKRLSEYTGISDVEDMALGINAVIAKKSAYTVVTDGINTYKITSGCAAMAKGGSGDALSGIIGAYACRITPLMATALGCYHFGKSGEKAAAIKGENAVLASDIIDCL